MAGCTGWYPIIHAEADSLRPIGHYLNRINAITSHYNCPRGNVYLPHDARAKSLQTGRSIVEQFLTAGIRPIIVPQLDVLDGIAAARLLFPEVYFNADMDRASGPCYTLVDALKTYRRTWDEERKAFSNRPIEDWSVHYADCFRYFALVARKLPQSIDPTLPRPARATMPHYPISLDDLWRDHDGRVNAENDWIK